MYKTLFLLTILVGHSLYGQTKRLYQIKSCKTISFFSDGVNRDTITTIFDDSGLVEKDYRIYRRDTSKFTELVKQLYGTRTLFHKLEIQTKDTLFMTDLDLMTAKKFANSNPKTPLYTEKEKKKIGEGVFLGKKCDIVKVKGFTIWYWKGIQLKKIPSDQNDKYYTYHVFFIDENYIIKEDEFKFPTNMKITNHY